MFNNKKIEELERKMNYRAFLNIRLGFSRQKFIKDFDKNKFKPWLKKKGNQKRFDEWNVVGNLDYSTDFYIRNNFILNKNKDILESISYSKPYYYKLFDKYEYTSDLDLYYENPQLQIITEKNCLFFYIKIPSATVLPSLKYGIGDKATKEIEKIKKQKPKLEHTGIIPVCVFDLNNLPNFPEHYKDNPNFQYFDFGVMGGESPFYMADPMSLLGFDFERELEKLCREEWDKVSEENVFIRDKEREEAAGNGNYNNIYFFKNDFFEIEYTIFS